MTQNQKPNPNYLELTEEQLEKVARRKAQEEASKVSPEWRLLAEFGYYFGWEGIQAVRNNEIDLETFNNLLGGARKAWASQVVDLATMTYTSVGATNVKKPLEFMRKGLKQFYNEIKP